MLSKLLNVVSCTFVLCLLLIAGTRLLARRDPPPRIAALLPDPSCEPPCWMGFRPGYIRPEELQSWLDDPPGDWQTQIIGNDTTPPGFNNWQIALPNADSFGLTVVRFNSPLVDRLMLWPENLALGDLIAVLRQPDFIDFTTGRDAQNRRVLEFRVYYQEPRLVARGTILLRSAALYPNTPVDALVYEAPPWSRPVLAFDWLGFGSLKRYYPHGVQP